MRAALKSYENPNTPPSKSPPKKTQREIQERDISRAQRPGREQTKPHRPLHQAQGDRTQKHTADCCDDCGSKRITRNGTKSKIVTGIMIVTENVIQDHTTAMPAARILTQTTA